jgi:Tfp pilus assembly protein PilO
VKLIEVEPRENLRLYLGLLLLVSLSYYAFWFRPLFDRVTLAGQEYRLLAREIVTGQRKAQELLGYAQRVRDFKGEVLRLEQRLRAGNQVLLFFKDAEQAAAHAGIELGSLEPGPPQAVEDITRQPVAVTVAGNLTALLHFVRHLEGLPYPLRVTKLDFSTEAGAGRGGQEARAPGVLAATVLVEMYSLSSGQGAEGPAGVAEPGGKAGETR